MRCFYDARIGYGRQKPYFCCGQPVVCGSRSQVQALECRLVAEAALPVGLAGFLIGVISMLAAESNPGQIAPAVAIAILTLVYAGIVRLFFVDSLNQDLLEAHSLLGKAVGTGGVVIMMIWAMTSVSPDGLPMFWYPQVAMVMTGVALLVFLIGRLVGAGHASGWAKKMIGLGWLGFFMGVVAALPQLNRRPP